MAEIGDRIGPFEIIELLERGEVSNVYRGLRADGSSRPPREVVLRVAAGGPEGPNPEAFAAVRAEYETLRVLEDERIPQAVALYWGHGASAKLWVNGGTLRDTLTLVEAGRIDLDAATSMDILVELAYALRHVHSIVRDEGRIVHGALAPEVVLLTAEGKVMLVGMGDPEPSHPRPLAPEQQQGQQDPRTDQWLLGALGIELLRHAPELLPEARGAPIEVAYSLLQARWPAAARVLARLLAESPSNRYEAEERLIKDLLALSRHLGGVSRRAEVGARTMQLAPSLGGVEAPPMPVATLVRRRAAEAARPPAAPVAPPVAAPAAAAVAIRPSARVPAIHPSVPPVVQVDGAPARPHVFFESPDMEEVVAYTEETPLPFRPRRQEVRVGSATGGPAVPTLAGPTLAEVLLHAPLLGATLDGDAETTTVEARPFSSRGDGPAVRRALADAADAQPTEIYRPGLQGNPFAGPSITEAVHVDEEWADEPAPRAVPDALPDGVPNGGADDVPDGLDGSGVPEDAPVRSRPATPPLEDPVPDRWVVGAIVMFVVVTAIVVAWRLSG
ncbi:MAG: hypothetical protein Q8P18_20020 [Pseudomonadota bacterium]|nr:hypothetical protein [Pseudomonadota bacterium]